MATGNYERSSKSPVASTTTGIKCGTAVPRRAPNCACRLRRRGTPSGAVVPGLYMVGLLARNDDGTVLYTRRASCHSIVNQGRKLYIHINDKDALETANDMHSLS